VDFLSYDTVFSGGELFFFSVDLGNLAIYCHVDPVWPDPEEVPVSLIYLTAEEKLTSL
jgi:hypothetical protein